VKLLDFGIAQFRQNPNRKNATAVGSRMGTPAFMPPEQARGHTDRVDARSDIFSVGATLLEMLTGRVLHDAPTANEKLLLAMTKAAAPARELVPRGSEALWAVLDQSLAFERDERFASAEAMQQALRVAARGMDAQVQAHPGGTLKIPEGGLPPLEPLPSGVLAANASPWAAPSPSGGPPRGAGGSSKPAAWGTPPASAAPSDGRMPAHSPRSRPAVTPPASGVLGTAAPMSGAYPQTSPSAPQHASPRPVQPSGAHGTVALGVFASDAAAEWAPPGSSVYAANPNGTSGGSTNAGTRKPQWGLMGIGALLCAAIATAIAVCSSKSAPVAAAVSNTPATTVGGTAVATNPTAGASLASTEAPSVTATSTAQAAVTTNAQRNGSATAVAAGVTTTRPVQPPQRAPATASHAAAPPTAPTSVAVDPLRVRR
jgi:Protein kinase domain